MLTRSRTQFEKLLFKAKCAYIAEEQDHVVIKMISEETTESSGENWRQVALRSKRDLASVIVEAGVKERLEADITEFCKAEKWYTSRGVPWRRGFLLHGKSLRRNGPAVR
jgi:chaperone BCS1